MIRSKVNAMGDPCPIPVVKTKNAIRELQGQAGSVEVLVDNEIAVQNLQKWQDRRVRCSCEKVGSAEISSDTGDFRRK